MPLQSQILSGNAFLESVARGTSLLYAGSPANDRAAVQILQQALAVLGFPLPASFRSGIPDGRFGQETTNAVVAFQKKVFPNQPREWDGRVGKKTLGLLDTQILRGKQNPAPVPPPPPAPVANFVCGPDITAEVRSVWTRIQTEFKARSRRDKIKLCNRLLLPINNPGGLVAELMAAPLIPGEAGLEKVMAKVRAHADIDGWDVLPLFQGLSKWLRTPPVFDPARNGPFATPSSSDPENSNPFAPGHEDAATCSNTVQVAGKCWLGGTVNYGTFGIMVRQCSDFAADDIFPPNLLTLDPFDHPLKFNVPVRAIYSLTWAKMLIKAYKQFGNNPEGATIPVAWTTATFDGGPNGTPGIPGNRPKCQCKPGLTGNLVRWDYVWEPLKPRAGSTLPLP